MPLRCKENNSFIYFLFSSLALGRIPTGNCFECIGASRVARSSSSPCRCNALSGGLSPYCNALFGGLSLHPRPERWVTWPTARDAVKATSKAGKAQNDRRAGRQQYGWIIVSWLRPVCEATKHTGISSIDIITNDTIWSVLQLISGDYLFTINQSW